MARREKKPVHKVVMTEGKRNIIQQLLGAIQTQRTAAHSGVRIDGKAFDNRARQTANDQKPYCQSDR